MLAARIIPVLGLCSAMAGLPSPGSSDRNLPVPERPQLPTDPPSQLLEESSIGSSAGGRPIRLWTIAAEGPSAVADRPGILIVAGAHGGHRRGVELAEFQAKGLVDQYEAGDEATRELLSSRVVYIVPELSPDAFALGRIGNATALDLDRDQALDEDGHDDLDGDGEISWMRWPDPDGDWIVDPDEPRLMRLADRSAGERGTHSLAREGTDDDGDGERDENPAQGRLVHRNFAHRFDEFDRRTGPFPMSEPETRALADFVFAHRNLVMAFVYGPEDTLSSPPKTDKPKARVQLEGILEDDKALYEKVSELYVEQTDREGDARDEVEGRVWSWLNFQVGIPAFATDVWRVPATLEVPGDAEGDVETLKGDRARLAHCDQIGFGFVPWNPVDHSDLEGVEVGGFVSSGSGFEAGRDEGDRDRAEGSTNLDDDRLWPESERAEAFAKHHAFFLQVTEMGPRARIRSFTAEALPGSAFRLRAVVENEGDWPTRTATGQRSRRFSSPRIELQPGDTELVLGSLRQRIGDLEPFGGSEELTWIVTGESGDTLRLILQTDPIGRDSVEVTL